MVKVIFMLYELQELMESAQKRAMIEFCSDFLEEGEEANLSEEEIKKEIEKRGLYFHSNGSSVELWEYTTGALEYDPNIDFVVENEVRK